MEQAGQPIWLMSNKWSIGEVLATTIVKRYGWALVVGGGRLCDRALNQHGSVSNSSSHEHRAASSLRRQVIERGGDR